MAQPPTITTGIPYPGLCHALDSLPSDSFVEEGLESLAVWLMTGEHCALDLYLPQPAAEKDWIANSGAATLHHHRQPLSRALPDSWVLNLVSESSKKVKNLQLHGWGQDGSMVWFCPSVASSSGKQRRSSCLLSCHGQPLPPCPVPVLGGSVTNPLWHGHPQCSALSDFATTSPGRARVWGDWGEKGCHSSALLNTVGLTKHLTEARREKGWHGKPSLSQSVWGQPLDQRLWSPHSPSPPHLPPASILLSGPGARERWSSAWGWR